MENKCSVFVLTTNNCSIMITYREKRNQKIEMERLVDVLPKMRESDTGG